MIKFAIVGIRRTGTTLIRTTLDNHPDIRCKGEVFNFDDRFYGTLRGFKCEESYRNYINQIPLGRFRDLIMRKKTVYQYLDDLYSDPSYKAIGFKIMQSQSQKMPNALEYMKEHQVRVIHVVRKNHLKTLVSCLVKIARGQSHTKTAVKKTQISIREDRVMRQLTRFESECQAWEDQCKSLPYVKVFYEDFVADKNRELSRMLDLLEMDHLSNLESQLVKGSPDDLREIVINYDAIAAILKGTRFEWCLTGDNPQ